ncbi:caspase family protein [Leptothrix discophora]|uniref:Caspase family protein n=1 Tax=Leptothrix discophora TaxID=89 RepID=A0ABT9G4Q1_LEPDI|nr:caspase family protein [Leptothrix discophora]MDP4301468.1 caspase family protein [Leptothrix discophora]
MAQARTETAAQQTTARKAATKQVAATKRAAAKKTGSKVVAPAARKPIGLSLHIGLNSVSPKHYGGWSGDLVACEADARDMAAVATSRGIKPTVLLTKAATRARVLAELDKAAQKLVSGDYFLLSFSGHGGQVDDVTGDEDDKLDETWCLYDSQLIDDETYLALSRFATGVRILVLTDSCHSGTSVRAAPPIPGLSPIGPRPRQMPTAVARRTYAAHQAFYDKLQRDIARTAAGRAASADPDAVLASLTIAPNSTRLTGIVSRFKASVVLISGCQDNQTSMDGEHNGAFTEQLLKVWNGGKFKGNHRLFHSRIRAGLPPTQSPNLYTLGPVATLLTQAPILI